MNFHDIENELYKVAENAGVIACALVAIDTGMIYLATSKNPDFEIIAEGARDYWTLHFKNGEIFSDMGMVSNIFIQHTNGLLSIQPCGKNTILITQATLGKIDWTTWGKVIKPLRNLINEHQ